MPERIRVGIVGAGPQSWAAAAHLPALAHLDGFTVTAVATTRSIARDDHVRMVVDKPFVFALRDRRSGLILFMGYVGAPPKNS